MQRITQRIALAASLALALASTAFAQDTPPPTDPASSSSDQAAPADSQSSMSSDTSDQQAAPAPKRHHRRRMVQQQSPNGYNPAAEALTGNEPKDVAYQYSNRVKQYPAVDHGHVPGDPPVIDHSGDQAPVANPTQATITVPPGH